MSTIFGRKRFFILWTIGFRLLFDKRAVQIVLTLKKRDAASTITRDGPTGHVRATTYEVNAKRPVFLSCCFRPLFDSSL